MLSKPFIAHFSCTSLSRDIAFSLINDFHGAVDDYLALCKEEGSSPEIAYKGSFNVRFKKKENHRRAAIYARTHGQSLNSFIEEDVEERLNAMHA